VVARLGAAPAPLGVEPAQTTKPLKLGTLTRHAVLAAPGSAFELRVGRGRRLDFSIAAVAPPGAAGSARFRIEATSPDGPRSLFDESIPADGAPWRDRRVELPPGCSALRFAADAEGEATPAWGSITLSAPERPERASRPNVVLVSFDTLGAEYLSALGGPPGTSPHIDAFLAQGFSFRRAFAQYGNTLVSHATLFSGLYPIHHRVYPGLPARQLDESLVGAFAADGYATSAFTEGAFVSANFGFSVGFDHYDDGSIGLESQLAGGAARTFERAGDWLEAHRSEERFFLFVHTYEVHAPYLPRDAEARAVADRLTPGDARQLPRRFQEEGQLEQNRGTHRLSPRNLARLRALYIGEISYLDRVFGRFLARLDALGISRDTLVVVTADHGDQFGEQGKVGHGESLHNRVMHVPLAFRWPAQLASGESDAPVQLADVLPTLLELAGVPAPAGLDGRSLVPVLRGLAPGPGRPAFSEERSARGECEELGLPDRCRLDRVAAQDGRFKLVTSRVPPYERLYDLADDPGEQRDVAQQHPEEAARLRSRIEAYRASARSARAQGPERAPLLLDADTRRRLRELGYAD
jgi:arylsulfatase A-like enzyme